MAEFILQNLPLPYPDHSFDGKTVVVTGSNTGLGLEAARHFTRLGAEKVILAVRNLEKGEAAKKSIEDSTDRTNVVECWKLDMSTFSETIDFIEKIQKLPRLDVLVLNAALAPTTRRTSLDGWEETLQVNVLSTALLALRLLPKMVSSAKKHPGWTPRMVIVSSEVHGFPTVISQSQEWPLPTDKLGIMGFLNDEQKFGKDIPGRYPVSKLFDIYITRQMAKITPMSDSESNTPAVIVNTLNPGLCYSELGRELGWGHRLLCFAFARSTEKGSRTLVDAASKGIESHGKYLNSCKIAAPSQQLVTSDEGNEIQKRVWGEIVDILEAVSPGVKHLAGY